VKDPYETLGIARTASQDDIRKAYRRLAKKLHPDLHPGNKAFEEKFKELSIANSLLADEDKRKRFDAGEIDALGAEVPKQQFYKDYADQATPGHAYENPSSFQDFADSDDIFAALFKRQARQSRNVRGADLRYRLPINFLDAILGSTKRITVPDGGTLDVNIPAGIKDGQTLRLKGKGSLSPGEGQAGDALVEVSVKPHRFFSRIGDNIHLELPITLSEAVLGARIQVPTPSGSVMLTIPKGSNTGSTMRLKGKGVPHRGGHGDEFIILKVMLPTNPNVELENFLSTWAHGPNYDPRKGMQA
jgi:DnaJ-class molecular chaperone